MSEPWKPTTIRQCLVESFAGEWGGNPRPGNAKVLRATDIDDDGHVVGPGAIRQLPIGKLNSKRLLDGDILLEGSGGGPGKPVGRVAYFEANDHDEASVCSNFFKTLRPKRSEVEPRFLLRKLAWFYKQPALLTLQQQTTGIINLKFEEYLSSQIAIPESIGEQQKLALVLDTLDTTIHETEAIIAKLKAVKQGLLHDLLTRGIDANGELRPPQAEAPHLYKESPLGWIPKEWDVVRVGEDVDIEHGFAFPGHQFTDKEVGPTLLVPGNFHREGDLYFTRENTKYFSGKYPQQYVLSHGDVLVVMTDLSPMTLILGRTVVLTETFKVLHNQRIGKFRFKKDGLWDTAFFAESLSQDAVRLRVIAEATGTTVRHTSPDRIKSCYVSRPNLPEQQLAAQRIATVVSSRKLEVANLLKLRQTKSGLMDDLLTGRIRVTSLLAEDAKQSGSA